MTTPMPAFDYESTSDTLTAADISSIVAMAWSDQVSFEMIENEWGLNESAVRDLMRHQLKSGSYRVWRQRVQGRATKHSVKQDNHLKGIV